MRSWQYPDGECWKDVNERARNFIEDEILNECLQKDENCQNPENTKKDFLVVTHGGFIMEFINCYKSYIDPDYKEVMNFDVRNTCVNKFSITQEIRGD